jgi:aryl-alcohol dehydrogenase-like predicted oxidoreductase
LGKIGFDVTILGLGGQGSLEHHGGEKNCIKIIQRAFDLGINYFDTSPIYGPSEIYYGKAMGSFRKKIFLATKTDDRTRNGSLRFLERSLKRLKTDYIDLWQIHHLDKIEEVNEVSRKGGALEALTKMKDEGVVRNLGFTGHENPEILEEMSKRFDFDTILMPVNAAERHVKPSFIEKMIPIANSKGLGITGMKVFTQGYIFNKDGLTTTWEPLHYALSQDIDTIIVGCDNPAQLEENILIAKMFKKLDPSELKEIENKTKSYVRAACFFRSKFGGYDSKKKLKERYII